MANRADLLQGTLDLLVLKALLLGPLHGWAITKRLARLSDDVLNVGQGSLYPALYRLEDQGWISSEWGISARRAPRQGLHAHRARAQAARRRTLGVAPLCRRRRTGPSRQLTESVSMPDRAAQLKRRLRALFTADAVDGELNDEIRLHLEMRSRGTDAHRGIVAR